MVNFINGITPINDVNLNKAQQDLHNEIEERKATVLYENAEGTIGNVTLSENLTNYKTFEIEFKLGNNYASSGRISTEAINVMLSMNRYASQTVLQIISNQIGVNNNTLTRLGTTYATISSKTLSGQGDDVYFSITKVTAYDKINTEQEV